MLLNRQEVVSEVNPVVFARPRGRGTMAYENIGKPGDGSTTVNLVDYLLQAQKDGKTMLTIRTNVYEKEGEQRVAIEFQAWKPKNK